MAIYQRGKGSPKKGKLQETPLPLNRVVYKGGIYPHFSMDGVFNNKSLFVNSVWVVVFNSCFLFLDYSKIVIVSLTTYNSSRHFKTYNIDTFKKWTLIKN